MSQNTRVTYSGKDVTVEEALDGILKQLDLGYHVVSKDKDRYDGWLHVEKGTHRGYPAGVTAPKTDPKDPKPQPKSEPKQSPKADPFAEKSVWVNTGTVRQVLTVTERKGETFRARFEIGAGIDRDVSGTVKDVKVSCSPKT